MFAIGEYVDEWGCTFVNIQEGVIGEVKQPIVEDWAADRGRIRFPEKNIEGETGGHEFGFSNGFYKPADEAALDDHPCQPHEGHHVSDLFGLKWRPVPGEAAFGEQLHVHARHRQRAREVAVVGLGIAQEVVDVTQTNSGPHGEPRLDERQ